MEQNIEPAAQPIEGHLEELANLDRVRHITRPPRAWPQLS
jgi:hypothetical protein